MWFYEMFRLSFTYIPKPTSFTCQRALPPHQRALRTNVPDCYACQGALRANVPTCFACQHVKMRTFQRTLRTNVPTRQSDFFYIYVYIFTLHFT